MVIKLCFQLSVATMLALMREVACFETLKLGSELVFLDMRRDKL